MPWQRAELLQDVKSQIDSSVVLEKLFWNQVDRQDGRAERSAAGGTPEAAFESPAWLSMT